MLAATAAVLANEDLLATPTNDQAGPPIKIDKNLRRALLRALVDLEAESAEQHREEEEAENDESTINRSMDIEKKDLNNNFGTVNKFSVEEFNNREIPSEDNLQNSTFIEIEKYVPASTTTAAKEEEVAVNEVKYNRIESKSHGREETSTLGNDTQKLVNPNEILALSASNGIATANALVAPKPTVSSPTASPADNSTKSGLKKKQQESAEEVKIFQAPLIAAFTVQQDERGVPKSVVPIYKGIGNAQALTLQEQLEFKQKLLEKQLAELQQQQIQQTQFLLQQRQLYEEQLRRKQRIQQEQRFREEQVLRQKQILEQQNRVKLLEEQRQNQIEEQKKLKQLEEQRFFQEQQQQQQKRLQQQAFNNFDQANQIHSNFKTTNVRLQPSLTLEVPTQAAPPPFRQQSLVAQQSQQSHRNNNQFQQQQFQQQIQQFQQFQQQLPFQQVQQPFQQLQGFAEVPPITAPATRFHRQEAFGSVGNFGINNNVEKNNVRTNFIFPSQQRFTNSAPLNNFNFANLNQFRRFPQATQNPPSSPARQIQHLLYQSGVANNLAANGPGPAGQEDLNIVSKVLALNVGAFPNNNLQFSASHPVPSFVKLPNVS